ncbi:hypothetical protein niasHT_016651 [Heterodera trifolii]|uniref:Maestro/Maestro-like HEAT-repeats domain-containing protein n=1 Tax=Heterodera trifolii TaxID=157864 RepID=A0ABD2KUB1_9BILA
MIIFYFFYLVRIRAGGSSRKVVAIRTRPFLPLWSGPILSFVTTSAAAAFHPKLWSSEAGCPSLSQRVTELNQGNSRRMDTFSIRNPPLFVAKGEPEDAFFFGCLAAPCGTRNTQASQKHACRLVPERDRPPFGNGNGGKGASSASALPKSTTTHVNWPTISEQQRHSFIIADCSKFCCYCCGFNDSVLRPQRFKAALRCNRRPKKAAEVPRRAVPKQLKFLPHCLCSHRPLVVTAELTSLTTVPANLISAALKAFAGAHRRRHRCGADEHGAGVDQHFEPATVFTQAIASFARAFLDFRPHFVGSLMAIEATRLEAGPHLSSEAERISATRRSFRTDHKSPHENGPIQSRFVRQFCFQALEKALRDPNLTVRKLAIHGIGHTDHLRGADRAELLAHFRAAFNRCRFGGFGRPWHIQDQLACEAIAALDRLVAVSEPSLLVRVLPQLLLKVRPCFEKENAALRASAFSLFAGLGATVGNCETFRESLQNNMMSIVLHLNDEEDKVQRCFVPAPALLNSEHATALVEHELADGKVPSNYADFLRQFGMILPLSFPDRLNTYALDCNNYFRSQSTKIRQNAAMLIGFMLTALTPELRGTLSKDLIFSDLSSLLRDPDEDVRVSDGVRHRFALRFRMIWWPQKTKIQKRERQPSHNENCLERTGSPLTSLCPVQNDF